MNSAQTLFDSPRFLLAAALAALPLAPIQAADQVPLTDGHMDLGIGYEDGALVPHFHAHDPEPEGAEYAPGEAVVVVGSAAQTSVPSAPAFGFLGAPGMPIWILPAIHIASLPFLGLAAEEIELGQFEGDTLRLSLDAVTGPGEFALYKVDGFGQPTVLMDTRDGISMEDFAAIGAGTHAHANWAFSAPGAYGLTLTASGTLLAGGELTSSGTFNFLVVPEPGTLAMLALGASTLIRRRRTS